MKEMKIGWALALVTVGAMAAAPIALAAGKSNPNVLNGVYRVAWTKNELLAAGVSPEYARSAYGVTTLTLRGGRFRWHPASHPPDCNNGRYTISGHQFFLDFRGTGCQGTVRATWALDNRQLRFRSVRGTDPGDAIFFGSKPWKKIG